MDQWNSAAKSVCACEIAVENTWLLFDWRKGFLSMNLQTMTIRFKFEIYFSWPCLWSTLTVSFNRTVMKNALLFSENCRRGLSTRRKTVEKIKIKLRANE
jgi:hypothetical protein